MAAAGGKYMRNLFFYGTLRYVPLLEIVLGRPVTMLNVSQARLPGHLVSAVAEGPFPMIAQQAGAVAHGLLIEDLSPTDIARIDFYEGSFAYDLVTVVLASGQSAEVYLPRPGQWRAHGPWSLATWEADWAEMSCHAAREVMGYFGERTPEQIAAMFPMIRSRAASKVRAAASLHGALTHNGSAEIISRTRAYAKFFALDDMTIRHDRFQGEPMQIERAVFYGIDAAILLPYDPARDRVLLVEQFRVGPLARGDQSVWQLEPIAGLVDAGETPQEAALREAQEEAGLTLHSVEKVAEVYATPGNSAEFYYIYLGLADLPDDIIGIGGLDAEGEDIRSHLLSFDELMSLVDDFGAANAPLVLAALWLARHRERLRSA